MKAVIVSGAKQYLVSPGDVLDVDLLKETKDRVEFKPLLVIDGQKTIIGQPELTDYQVLGQVLEPEIKLDKVVAIRFKAKKRVHKRRGHRQSQTRLKILKIKKTAIAPKV